MMTLDLARRNAEDIVRVLAPVCERIAIAGSIRREKPDGIDGIKDIEVVCIPRSRDLVGFKRRVDSWQRVRGDATGRYTQRIVAGQKLDLFMASRERWACVLLFRTGNAGFSQAVVTHAHDVGMVFKDGRLWALRDQGERLVPVDVAEERDVFAALALRYVEPRHRVGPQAVIPV